MSFRVITICLEDQESAQSLTTVASGIAGTRPTHIQTVHVLPAGYDYVAVSPYAQGVALTQLYDRYREIAADIKQSFLDCQQQFPESISWNWHEYDGVTLSDFEPYVNHAMVSDLVICSKLPTVSMGSALPRTLVRESATPVLVVPEGESVSAPFKRISIAWNATPESARAIRDALPLLKEADEVLVLNVTRSESPDNVPGADIARYLGEHDIRVRIDFESASSDIGKKLLDHVTTNRSDLLVMGGFGHSSLYNLVLGAATPWVLKELPCPVFMSH